MVPDSAHAARCGARSGGSSACGAGLRPTSGPPVGICKKGPVDGLYIVTDFLSIEEVELLRDLFSAHHGWAMYNWGNVGRRNELASVLQRIDFGLPEMTAEGVAASGSNGTQVQPIGELQQHVISLLEMRMRAHFGEVAWGGEDPTPEHRPNMLQFTRIAPGTCLGNHFDRRDKWEEGIASIAWGQAPGQEDSRGDPVRACACMHAYRTQCMRLALLPLLFLLTARPFVRLFRLSLVCAVGAQDAVRPARHRPKETLTTIPPGSAYILTGVSQGRTGFCSQRKVAHNMCSCCWTHGIWNEESVHTRESITMRVFDTEWGRDIILNAVEVVAVEVADDDEEVGGGAGGEAPPGDHPQQLVFEQVEVIQAVAAPMDDYGIVQE